MALQNRHLARVARMLLNRGSKGAGGVLSADGPGRRPRTGERRDGIGRHGAGQSEQRAYQISARPSQAHQQDRGRRRASRQRSPAFPSGALPTAGDGGPRDAPDVRRRLPQRGARRDNHSGAHRRSVDDDGSGASLPTLALVPTSQASFRAAERRRTRRVRFAGRGGIIENLLVEQRRGRGAGIRACRPADGRVHRRLRLSGRTAAGPSAGHSQARSPAALAVAPRTPARPVARLPRRERRRQRRRPGCGRRMGCRDGATTCAGSRRFRASPTPAPSSWGNRVFVVTAISSAGDKTFRTGLYGDVAPVKDVSEHTWKIYALDKSTGKVLWDRNGLYRPPKGEAPHQGQSGELDAGQRRPPCGRDVRSIIFLAAWDMDGKPLWKRTSSVLDSGWFFDPDTQWGHSSSPIIYGDNVIVQADRYKDSFIAAYDAETGKQLGAPRGTRFRGGERRRYSARQRNSLSPTARRSAGTIRQPASSCGRSAQLGSDRRHADRRHASSMSRADTRRHAPSTRSSRTRTATSR